jgi:uncharacterized protein YndB with AHSA1/START domain
MAAAKKKTRPKARKASAPKAKAAKPKARASTKAKNAAKPKARKATQAKKAIAKPKAKKGIAKPKTKNRAAKPKAGPTVEATPLIESLELRASFAASPERVLAAWLDSAEHSAFTGSDATVDARVGGKHTAWTGEILEIQPGRRVVMSWRTTEFAPAQPDSIVVVEADREGGGTALRLLHTELPPGGAEKYGKGWREFYFAPMTSYFRSISN